MKRFRGILVVVLAALWMGAVPARAGSPESKIFIYVIYNKSSPGQRAFVGDLFSRFNRLGFADRMKKKGVSWVEASYTNVASVASYLHIAPDEIPYFGVLMADKTDRITREMYRAHIVIPRAAEARTLQALADDDAHRFYFELADVVDNFQDPVKWNRQVAMLNPRGHKAGEVKVVLESRDVTRNRKWFPSPPFQRRRIHVVMTPFDGALWKRLGADGAGVRPLSGGRTELWVKKGARRIIFEVGSAVTDMKTYLIRYGGGLEKTFINPTKPTFAYPEIQGRLVFVPLQLVVQELRLPFACEVRGFTVTLTSAGGGVGNKKGEGMP